MTHAMTPGSSFHLSWKFWTECRWECAIKEPKEGANGTEGRHCGAGQTVTRHKRSKRNKGPGLGAPQMTALRL